MTYTDDTNTACADHSVAHEDCDIEIVMYAQIEAVKKELTVENKDAIRKWVGALRSGVFRQIKRAFHTEGTAYDFCAIGVGLRVLGAGINSTTLLSTSDAEFYRYHPTTFQLRTGLPLSPFICYDGHVTGIVDANDILGWSFVKIADALEATYLPEDICARQTQQQLAEAELVCV